MNVKTAEQQNLRVVFALSKIRARFEKVGDLKFISHLDTMRLFERTFRRANLELKHTQGFNKHAIMSFAAPMAIGLTSEDEYIDFELEHDLEMQELTNRINNVIPNGIRIVKSVVLPDNAKSIMSLISAAKYKINIYIENKDEHKSYDLESKIKEMLNNEAIVVEKKTKKGMADVDIKDLIYECNLKKENDFEYVIDLLCSSGSSANLGVEVFMNAVNAYCDLYEKMDDYLVHRENLYVGDRFNLKSPINI